MRLLMPLLVLLFAPSAHCETDPFDEALKEFKAKYGNYKPPPDRYYKCLLSELPGTTDDRVARLIVNECSEKSALYNLNPTTWFGYSNPNECIIESSKNTTSRFAVTRIIGSCNTLYGK